MQNAKVRYIMIARFCSNRYNVDVSRESAGIFSIPKYTREVAGGKFSVYQRENQGEFYEYIKC